VKRIAAEKKPMSTSGSVFVLGGVLVVGVALGVALRHSLQESSFASIARQNDQSKKYKSSVDYYRALTGSKLNRERVNKEIENYKYAPPIASSGVGVTAQGFGEGNVGSQAGVPLQQEALHRADSRAATTPIDPTFADARVLYDLQEDHDAREWERRAQDQYVKDFIANAAAHGLAVKIDKNLNVINVKRIPQSGPEGHSQSNSQGNPPIYPQRPSDASTATRPDSSAGGSSGSVQ
jgi:hypothetical protein